MVVAPVAVVSTIVLFATGVALLVLDRTSGTVVGLHKASFVVWFGAVGVHVLVRVARLPGRVAAARSGVAAPARPCGGDARRRRRGRDADAAR